MNIIKSWGYIFPGFKNYHLSDPRNHSGPDKKVKFWHSSFLLTFFILFNLYENINQLPVGITFICQLEPSVGHVCKNSAKISDILLWESRGYNDFIIKHVLLCVNCVLHILSTRKILYIYIHFFIYFLGS